MRVESSEETRNGLPSPHPFLDKRVIVIDDDSSVIAAMEALFTTWGATVVSGEDGEIAWRYLVDACAPCAPRADLIVADLRLADGRSGVDAIRTLRRHSGALTPALIISGDTTEGARAEAARCGIALLQKPVMAAALLAGGERALVAANDVARQRAAINAATVDA